MSIGGIRQHIGHVGDLSIQYRPSCCQGTIRPFRKRLLNLIKDFERKIVARHIVKKVAVIEPDNGEYRLAKTRGTFSDCLNTGPAFAGDLLITLNTSLVAV